MGSVLKTVAKVAAPIIGNAIAPGIGGVIGGAVSGAVGGGGIKGALSGALGTVLGNVGGGVLSNLTSGAGLQNLFKGVSIFGNGTAGALSKLSGAPLQTRLGNGDVINWNTAARAVPQGLSNVASNLPVGVSIGSSPDFWPELGTKVALGDILDQLGVTDKSGGLDFGALAKLAMVGGQVFGGDPEGLQSQADIAKAQQQAAAKEAANNQAFLAALNAGPLNRQQTNPNINYATYSQAPNSAQLFFDQPNPSMQQATIPAY